MLFDAPHATLCLYHIRHVKTRQYCGITFIRARVDPHTPPHATQETFVSPYALRLLLPMLHSAQSARRFSKVVFPPLEKGTMWSTCSSQPSSAAGLRPQSWQRNRSR
jgi:hypothetical protein